VIRSLRSRPLFWILAAATALRVAGLGFGLHHPDEHLIINHALAFGTGDLNPHMFYLPTFFMYLLFGLFGLFYATGFLTGVFSNPDDFLTLFLRQPELFYTLARTVSVVFGVATVGVIYLLGKEFKNKTVGTWAALFLAVNFLHVRDSHFATMDIALTFFMTLSLVYLLHFLNYKNKDAYWKAVAIAAVATATKYNGIVLILPIAVAYLADRPSPIALIRDFFISTLIFMVIFFCLSPYVFLDFATAIKFIEHLYMLNTHFTIVWSDRFEMLVSSIGLPFFILVMIGFLKCFWPIRLKNFILSLFMVAYCFMIIKAGQPFERYFLPLIPVSLIWAFPGAEWLTLKIKRPSGDRLILGLTVLILVLPKTIYQDVLFFRKDTRDLTREWIVQHIPPGEIIVLDDSGDAPRLTPSPDQVQQQIAKIDLRDPKSQTKKKRLENLLKLSPYPAFHYKIYFFSERSESPEFTMLTHSIPYSMKALRSLNARYLVVSEASKIARKDFYEKIDPYLEKVFVADPRLDKTKEIDIRAWTYTAIYDDVFWNLKHPGRFLYVYKINYS